MNGCSSGYEWLFDRDLRFVHRFQQRRLCLRRRAVDLIGQQEIREDRARFELELLRVRVINGDAQHVTGQHVAGELQAVKPALHRARQRVRERGLSDAGNVFDQQVPARQQAHQRQPHHIRLAANRSVERHLQFVEFGKRLRRGYHYCHCTLLKAYFSSTDDQNNRFAGAKFVSPRSRSQWGSKRLNQVIAKPLLARGKLLQRRKATVG